MATCKDNCLFAPLCKYNDGICEWCLSNCPLYKNKSRYIAFPCNVGDTVYRIVKLLNGETKIVEGEVFEIAITHEHHEENEYRFYFWAKGEEFVRRHHSIWCYFTDFGKTVFLTREKAEKALAERSNQ